MNAVEQLEQALDQIQRLGYQVRHEWLDEVLPGACVIHGQKLLILDLAQTPREQLETVQDVLREESLSHSKPRTVLERSPRAA